MFKKFLWLLYAGYIEIKQTERLERKCPQCILINRFMVAQQGYWDMKADILGLTDEIDMKKYSRESLLGFGLKLLVAFTEMEM